MKKKKFVTEQENKELRSLSNGSITHDVAIAAIEAAKEQRGINTAFYNRGEQSIEAFMAENFGKAIYGNDNEPAEVFLIDFER